LILIINYPLHAYLTLPRYRPCLGACMYWGPRDSTGALTVDDLPIVYVPSHLLLQETTWNLEGNDDSESGCLKAWNAERCLCMTEAKLQACKHIRQGSLVGMAIVSSLLAIGPALPAYLVVSWGWRQRWVQRLQAPAPAPAPHARLTLPKVIS